jgi:hypothetical protein
VHRTHLAFSLPVAARLLEVPCDVADLSVATMLCYMLLSKGPSARRFVVLSITVSDAAMSMFYSNLGPCELLAGAKAYGHCFGGRKLLPASLGPTDLFVP